MAEKGFNLETENDSRSRLQHQKHIHGRGMRNLPGKFGGFFVLNLREISKLIFFLSSRKGFRSSRNYEIETELKYHLSLYYYYYHYYYLLRNRNGIKILSLYYYYYHYYHLQINGCLIFSLYIPLYLSIIRLITSHPIPTKCSNNSILYGNGRVLRLANPMKRGKQM